MAMPRVTVAMPVFNGARFLAPAIESILGQTLRDFELVVSDDGSSDDSREIALAFARRDPRVVLLASERAGIAGNTNRILGQAKGEYFAPMDQDDMAVPERLARQVAFLDREKETAVVGGAARIVDPEGKELKIRTPASRPGEVAAAMHFSCAIIHPTSLMRTSAVRAVGGYRTVLPYAQDYDLWLRLMERNAVANLPDILLAKREHPKQVTSDWARRPAQVVAGAIAYLSYMSRQTGGPDIATGDRPLVESAAAFIDAYLSRDAALSPAVIHHFSRFVRYAPLLTSGPRQTEHPYSRYLRRALADGDPRNRARTVWYMLSFFFYNRYRYSNLFQDQGARDRLVAP